MLYLIKSCFTLSTISIVSVFLLFGNYAFADVETPETLSETALVQALKSGNHIIYMRHGLTTRKDKNRDKSLIDLTHCETQRNLTEAGKSQVKLIGSMVKSLNIPIGKVKSSPYCRAKDTAKAVFGDFDVDDNLKFSIAMENKESDMLGKYLLEAMLASHDEKRNTVFVGHTANLKDGLGIWPKPEGVMVILKKEGGKIIFKGMIKPDYWLNL